MAMRPLSRSDWVTIGSMLVAVVGMAVTGGRVYQNIVDTLEAQGRSIDTLSAKVSRIDDYLHDNPRKADAR